MKDIEQTFYNSVKHHFLFCYFLYCPNNKYYDIVQINNNYDKKHESK